MSGGALCRAAALPWLPVCVRDSGDLGAESDTAEEGVEVFARVGPV